MCYEGLLREKGSLTSDPPTPAQIFHTFPFIRDTVENVAWSCGRGGMQLASDVISSSLSTFLGILFVSFLYLIVIACLTEYPQNTSVIMLTQISVKSTHKDPPQRCSFTLYLVSCKIYNITVNTTFHAEEINYICIKQCCFMNTIFVGINL